MLVFIIFILLSLNHSYAYEFSQVVEVIENHPSSKAIVNQMRTIEEEGEAKSSWGDPKLSVSANNFPKDSLSRHESPMTGIKYSLSQVIPVTTKYSHIQKSYERLQKSSSYDLIHQKRALLQYLWNLAITKRNLAQDISILSENIGWLEDMIKVSKRLYANGKLSQQAVLELQIRKSEIEANLSNKRHALAHVEESLTYLKGDELKGELATKSVPWDKLAVSFSKEYDPNEVELGLKEKIRASEQMLKAERLSYVPDVNLSIGYTQRSPEVDAFGDFVSLGVTLSLPLSQKKYAQADGAMARKLKAHNELKNYHLKRKSELKGIEHLILKMEDELKIINKKSLSFARSSREITSKSYGLGNASYLELLQAELKYQNLLLRKNNLAGKLASKKVEYMFLRGDKLYGR